MPKLKSLRRPRHRLRRCLLLLLGIMLLLQWRIKPVVELVAAQRVHMTAIQIINETVYDHLGPGLKYEDLVRLQLNAQGQVTLIQPDTVQVSRLTTSIAQELEDKVGEMAESGVDIPLGLLTGHALLADMGPSLHVTIQPEGSVSVDVSDEFDAVGINQTRHRVVMDVTVSMGLLIPFSSTLVEITNSLPLVESVIVGPVPDTYLNIDGSLGGLREKLTE